MDRIEAFEIYRAQRMMIIGGGVYRATPSIMVSGKLMPSKPEKDPVLWPPVQFVTSVRLMYLIRRYKIT